MPSTMGMMNLFKQPVVAQIKNVVQTRTNVCNSCAHLLLVDCHVIFLISKQSITSINLSPGKETAKNNFMITILGDCWGWWCCTLDEAVEESGVQHCVACQGPQIPIVLLLWFNVWLKNL